MLKPLVPRFRSDLPGRIEDIAEKQVPAKLKPIVVSGLRKTLDLDSAGQQVLCDRTVEVGVVGATGYA